MKRLLRSGGVGALATAIDLLMLLALVAVGLSPRAANLPALLVGALVQFFGNKFFAFEDQSAQLVQQGALFSLIEVAALALNALAFHLVVSATTVHYGLARLAIGAAIYFLFSFPLWRWLVFDKQTGGAR